MGYAIAYLLGLVTPLLFMAAVAFLDALLFAIGLHIGAMRSGGFCFELIWSLPFTMWDRAFGHYGTCSGVTFASGENWEPFFKYSGKPRKQGTYKRQVESRRTEKAVSDLTLKVFYEIDNATPLHLDEAACAIAKEYGGKRVSSGCSADGWRNLEYEFKRESGVSEARDAFLWDGFILDEKPVFDGPVDMEI